MYHSHSRPRVVSALRGSPRCRSIGQHKFSSYFLWKGGVLIINGGGITLTWIYLVRSGVSGVPCCGGCWSCCGGCWYSIFLGSTARATGFTSTFSSSFFGASLGSSSGLMVAVAVVAVSLEPSFTPPEPELLTDVPSEYYRPSNTFSDSVITSSCRKRQVSVLEYVYTL